jgi:formylglycine-generating enzyme required for sulfatase activity
MVGDSGSRKASYCVIDLSAGANASSYPVTYLAEPPSDSFNVDEYKTTKLVLKRIEAGTFMMGGATRTTLSKPFYIGLFEVTQKQYSLVTGGNTSGFLDDKKPMEKVSYNAIRGSADGAKWPSSNAVDSSSFLGMLRAMTGLDFDLPTEAQWEYACRAGTTTIYSYGDSANENYMWYTDNSSSQTHDVGTRQPNPWGLYDMHGNVWEWCLDWYARSLDGGTDPKGSSSGPTRVERGGSWSYNASRCTSSCRFSLIPSGGNNSVGFRLAMTINQ